MNGVSVIICCYNSSSKLPFTLKHLANQIVNINLSFELILVNNNCSDDTNTIAQETWLMFGNPYPLTIVSETTPGLSFARIKGIQTALYDYIVLCDDDNWLCNDYLLKVCFLFNKMLEVSIIGGVGQAVADILFPEWFIKMNGFGYAIGSENRITGIVDTVYGAGMCLRKSAMQPLLADDFCFALTDRNGIGLSSGGDMEICEIFKSLDYKIYLDTSLTFKHYLNKERLTWGYYLNLRRAFGKASAYMQLYTIKIPTKSPIYKSGLREILSLFKFGIRNINYILFPNLYKNLSCANAVQQLTLRITCLLEKKQMNIVIRQIQINIKK